MCVNEMEEHDPNDELYSKLYEYINQIGNVSCYDGNNNFKNEEKKKKHIPVFSSILINFIATIEKAKMKW